MSEQVCAHPQKQGRRMRSADGTLDEWETWCPRCHHTWSDDGREWVEDASLSWPGQLVPVEG